MSSDWGDWDERYDGFEPWRRGLAEERLRRLDRQQGHFLRTYADVAPAEVLADMYAWVIANVMYAVLDDEGNAEMSERASVLRFLREHVARTRAKLAAENLTGEDDDGSD